MADINYVAEKCLIMIRKHKQGNRVLVLVFCVLCLFIYLCLFLQDSPFQYPLLLRVSSYLSQCHPQPPIHFVAFPRVNVFLQSFQGSTRFQLLIWGK